MTHCLIDLRISLLIELSKKEGKAIRYLIICLGN